MNKMVCNRDCFDCIYADCVQDIMTPEERQEINDRDAKYGLANKKNFSSNPNTYYNRNRERLKEKARERYRNNREKILENAKKKYQENIESERIRKREFVRRWREARKETENENQS